MIQTLRQFTKDTPLFDAASAFLGVLGIKHSGYATKEPLPLADYFDDKMPQYLQDANAIIAKLYDLGCVNDSSLGGTSSVENPRYVAMNIFAFDAKPQASITRTVVSSLTRAFNRIADDPVILIIRQGNYVTLSTCDREKGAKAEIMGKVTILRNVDCANPHPGHIQILDRIAKEVRGCSDFDTLYKKWLYSFSLKLLSDDFFDGYKAIYEDIIALTTGKRMKKEGGKWVERIDDEIPTEEKTTYGAKVMASFAQFEDPEKAVRDYVKKLMGRLVFIQFLQKKGWMGVPADKPWGKGDREFIQNVFKQSAKKNNFVDEVLEPLFRDINSDRAGFLVTSEEVNFGQQIKVPYLNGGLFEEDAYDRADFVIPAKYFWNENATLNTKDKDLGLLQFFSKYNFTIDENAPDDVEVGVDPEMLGRIFENLLEDNKDKGAFYTPKEIVHYMCRESLIAYLTTYSVEHGNTNPYNKVEAAIRTLVINPAEIVPQMQQHKPQSLLEFGDALRNIKVCDPAIGSGAFPMGLLNELVRCREAIGAWAKDDDGNLLVGNRAALKCAIVCNNIYGVDIERGAIDIARLRFWLSIVVDETTPQTLPNLDYKFMQGNSLITTFDGKYVNLDTKNQQHSKIVEMRKVKQELHKLKLVYYNATGDHKHKLDIKIKDAILRLISLQLGYEVWKWYNENVNQQLTMFPEKEQPRQLTFADIKQELPEETKRICDLGAELRKQLKDESKSLTERSQVDIRFFDWRMMFTEVFEGENPGFDIVIGNPPYLRIQGIRDVNPEQADILSETYESATGSFDMYVCFAELALNIINKDGIANFIMPLKWSNAAFGKGLRGLISKKNAATRIINFGAYQVFNASTYTALQWFKPNSKDLQYNELDRDLNTNSELGNYLNSLDDSSMSLIQNSKLTKDTWVLTAGSINKLLAKLDRQPRRVNDVFDKIFQGLATSRDDTYFLQHCTECDGIITGYSKDLDKNVEIEVGLVRPLLKGEDVHKYDAIATHRVVIFPYKIEDGKASLYTESELSELFPKGYAYLKECESILRNREHGRLLNDELWYRYIYPKNLVVQQLEKLVAPDISMGGNFAYDEHGVFYQTTTIYGYVKVDGVKASYRSLMAIMNSQLCWWFIQNTGAVMSGGFFRYKPAYLNPFPMPSDNAILVHQTEIETLVDQILSLKKQNPQADTSSLEHEIDLLVYDLYGLTKEERMIVDPEYKE